MFVGDRGAGPPPATWVESVVTADGARIYRRLGFRERCRVSRYLHPAPG